MNKKKPPEHPAVMKQYNRLNFYMIMHQYSCYLTQA